MVPQSARGTADYGWLQANYSFSFGHHHDPERMGFGLLRVLNQDHIQPSGGFGLHGHEDMEIITWIQSGELVHEDSMGNRGTLGAGEVQVMSAGRGVRHSEFNGSKTEGVDMLQMWILPAESGTPPRWEQRLSPADERRGQFTQLVGGHTESRDGLLTIGQDARMFVGLFDAGEEDRYRLAPDRCAYVHVARGELLLEGQRLGSGDGAEIDGTPEGLELKFRGVDGNTLTDVVLWDMPRTERGNA